MPRFRFTTSAGFLAPLVFAVGCASSTPEPSYPTSSTPNAQPYHEPPPGAAVQRGVASYYSDRLAGRSTASGEPYNPRELTAAHRTLPFGALVDVAREDGRHVVVRINDRGPFVRGRIIDLSRRAAAEIGLLHDGLCDVLVRVISMPPEKAKKKKRKRR